MRYALALTSLMLCFCTAQVEGSEQSNIPTGWKRYSYTLSEDTIEVALPSDPKIISDQIDCGRTLFSDSDSTIISADCPTLREGEVGQYTIIARSGFEGYGNIADNWHKRPFTFNCLRWILNQKGCDIDSYYIADVFRTKNGQQFFFRPDPFNCRTVVVEMQLHISDNNVMYVLISPVRELLSLGGHEGKDNPEDQMFFDSFKVMSDEE